MANARPSQRRTGWQPFGHGWVLLFLVHVLALSCAPCCLILFSSCSRGLTGCGDKIFNRRDKLPTECRLLWCARARADRTLLLRDAGR